MDQEMGGNIINKKEVDIETYYDNRVICGECGRRKFIKKKVAFMGKGFMATSVDAPGCAYCELEHEKNNGKNNLTINL